MKKASVRHEIVSGGWWAGDGGVGGGWGGGWAAGGRWRWVLEKG